ncbi:hypothetical protein I3843_07G052000 [Carya illinoinensis]|nr:hypothetical protein I3760_07G052900 [Carya illinoinensis]KAG7969827.1 hypothetical protein I3843_07G052000 [Carya illinoinensis]
MLMDLFNDEQLVLLLKELDRCLDQSIPCLHGIGVMMVFLLVQAIYMEMPLVMIFLMSQCQILHYSIYSE